MGLPTVQLPSEKVTLSDGQSVTVTGLTFAQFSELAEVEGEGLGVMFRSLAYATDSTDDEVRAWCAATPFEDVQRVADAVRRISKLEPAEGEASRAPSSARKRTRSHSSSPRSSA